MDHSDSQDAPQEETKSWVHAASAGNLSDIPRARPRRHVAVLINVVSINVDMGRGAPGRVEGAGRPSL
jgi:hypothetical protein